MDEPELAVFLSQHAGQAPAAREYAQTLADLGYEPWTDTDEAAPGVDLNPRLALEFERSCAAIFVLSRQISDATLLSGEVERALDQRRRKRERFAIIALVFERDHDAIVVPPGLRRHCSEATTVLEGLRVILRALPVKLGPPTWR